ncbi:MAG: RNase adapter RapZ [Clostridiales bacterium]|nr:RNase adapter RapZ [Clostridiales bacterium]
MELIILTGMSGAGKSQAEAFFEDNGFFCIDNLPPQFLPELVSMFSKGEGDLAGIDKLAFVVDIRSRDLLRGLADALKKIDEEISVPYRIVFLEASDEVLVSRYRQTRRKHPLTDEMSLTDAIAAERKMLQNVRGRATNVIDTTLMPISSLKSALRELLEDDGKMSGMSIFVESFGFMYGIPVDCDNVLDVRFLPNPYWVEDLKMFSGKDEAVADYLNGFQETRDCEAMLTDFFKFAIPFYNREGKSRLHIGIGCTGGRHRSVYIAEKLGAKIDEMGYRVVVHHRDIFRDPRYVKEG